MKNGDKEATIIDVCLGYAKSGGQQIEFLFEVEEDGIKDQIGCANSFAGKAAPYTLDKMRRCGWKDLEPVETLIGKRARIRVYDELCDDGVTRQRCEIPLGASLRTKPENRMNKREADSFLRSLVQPANAKPATKPMREMGDDDDMPDFR